MADFSRVPRCLETKVFHTVSLILFSSDYRSATLLSHFCPNCPIIVITRSAPVARRLHLYRGLFPLEYPYARKGTWTEDIDARLDFGIKKGLDMGFILPDSKVIFVCGYQPGSSTTNTMRILSVEGYHVIGTPESNITFK